MRRSPSFVRFAPLALAVLLGGALAPERAQAWTEVRVTGVSAQLDATQPELRATLSVSIRVIGGWLSSFELTGLDPDYQLAPDAPPVFETASGERYQPETQSSEPSVLMLVFPNKHAAPRRGDYTLHVTYLTHAPFTAATRTDAKTLRLRFRLPSWSESLSNVRVVVSAPRGSLPAAEHGADDLDDALVVHESASRDLITFTRPQLPRAQSFEVAVDVPASAYALASQPAVAPRNAGAALTLVPRSRLSVPLALALLVALLALAKRALTTRRCSREHLEARPLLPLPARWPRALRGALVLSLAAASGLAFSSAPLSSGLAALLAMAFALDRALVRRAVPADAHFRAATRSDFALSGRARASRWLGPEACLDATTPTGFFALALLHASWLLGPEALRDALSYAALLATPLFLTATHKTGPETCARTLRRLQALRDELRGLPLTTQLVVQETDDGRALAARLRIWPARVPAGMGKLEVTLADATFYGRNTWAFAWVAVSRDDSPADARLARALPDALCRPSEHATTERFSISASPALEAPRLLAWLTRELDPALDRAA